MRSLTKLWPTHTAGSCTCTLHLTSASHLWRVQWIKHGKCVWGSGIREDECTDPRTKFLTVKAAEEHGIPKSLRSSPCWLPCQLCINWLCKVMQGLSTWAILVPLLLVTNLTCFINLNSLYSEYRLHDISTPFSASCNICYFICVHIRSRNVNLVVPLHKLHVFAACMPFQLVLMLVLTFCNLHCMVTFSSID